MSEREITQKEKHKAQVYIEDTIVLLRSPEWKVWNNMLRLHKAHLQRKVNSCLRDGNTVEARVALGKLDDVKKQLNLFEKQLSEMKDIAESK